MISNLRFRIHYWPNDVVDLYFEYNKGLVSYTGSIEDPLFLDRKFEGTLRQKSTAFVEDLEAVGLASFREVYNSTTSGHYDWKMTWQERGEKPRHAQGKDAAPETFGQLIALLQEAVPEAAEDLAKWSTYAL